MKIAFLGLGRMGAGIAANLVRAGHDVTVWNRSPDKTAPLANLGASRASSPRAAAQGKAAVFTIVSDDAALDAVLEGDDGLLNGLAPGALHISMSTIAVATAERLTDRHQALGHGLVSAPVFGRPDAAAAGKLFIAAAGARDALELARPLLEVIGQKTFVIGDAPAMANLVKLCGNFTILAAVEAMAEAMALAAKGGVAPATLIELLTGSIFDAPVYRNYGAILVEKRYRPAGFGAPLGLKDMRLVGQAAERSRVAMPLLSLLRDHLLETIAKEGEDIDWSGIGLTVAKNAGL